MSQKFVVSWRGKSQRWYLRGFSDHPDCRGGFLTTGNVRRAKVFSTREDAEAQYGKISGWVISKIEVLRVDNLRWSRCEVAYEVGVEKLKEAAKQLGKSGRGRRAMSDLLALLDNGGCSLDSENQRAVVTLLRGAFGAFSGSAPEFMREELEGVK